MEKNCTKNPGHEKFMSVQEFLEKHLVKLRDVNTREGFRSVMDLTVRVRVHYTSNDRPDDDPFSAARGTKLRRSGTGFLVGVYPLDSGEPISCVECGGGDPAKTHWGFQVVTANHVVFNTEEARETQVDFFFDDESSEGDGRTKTVSGVRAQNCHPSWDRCTMLCTTCDGDLARRMQSALRHAPFAAAGIGRYETFLQSCGKNCDVGLMVSHPHGQPKKITVGEWRCRDYPREYYTVPTCPGSSGSRAVRLRRDRHAGSSDGIFTSIHSTVHSGSYTREIDLHEQINFSYWYNFAWR